MANERDLRKLEKEIYSKMRQIKSGTLLPKDSGIGKMINLMKSFDEPLYDKILAEYKSILASI
jgi:hypothetical protein